MSGLRSHSVAIVAAYFGSLPPYFPLWLRSCAGNPSFHWVIFTDDEAYKELYPANVTRVMTSLEDFATSISRGIGYRLSPASPYKLCDYKPLYWTVLDALPGRYDFWGHCDLDMIFGQLSEFVTDDLLSRYDKIFSVGHFTLYRNVSEANLMFSRPHPDISWKHFVLDPIHHGFDEHIGVNRIWALHAPDRCFADESLIADIDPHIKQFQLIAPHRNYKQQVFSYRAGGVFRDYRTRLRRGSDEFMYIHFQKRKFAALPDEPISSFFISPSGFTPTVEFTNLMLAAAALNPPSHSWKELAYRTRQKARHAIRSVRT